METKDRPMRDHIQFHILAYIVSLGLGLIEERVNRDSSVSTVQKYSCVILYDQDDIFHMITGR